MAIHEPDDGRGQRRVFVNGVEIKHAIFADTVKGIVDYHPVPCKVHKYEKRIISHRLRGNVFVTPIDE